MERIDGYAVDLYKTRISGAFDLEPEDGETLKYGETVVFIGVARVGVPGFAENRKGELVRTNILNAREFRLLEGEEAEEALASFGISTQLSLTTSEPEVHPPARDMEPVNESSVEDDFEEVLDGITGVKREYPSPSTVGASQRERDPVLAAFLDRR